MSGRKHKARRRREAGMKKVLEFSGDKAPKRFRLAWSLFSMGIAMSAKDGKRTVEDMRVESAARKALEDASATWADAKVGKFAPEDLLEQEQRDIAFAARKGEPLDEWNPRVQTGDDMRFLKPDATRLVLAPKQFQRLEAMVEKAAPVTAPQEVDAVVDLLDFIAAAKTEEDE